VLGELIVILAIALVVFGPMILKARQQKELHVRPPASETIYMDDFDRIWLDDVIDDSRHEPDEEAMLKARLDDAFLSLPSLQSRQDAVATIESWAEQKSDLRPDEAA
jgi:hypothetical protein